MLTARAPSRGSPASPPRARPARRPLRGAPARPRAARGGSGARRAWSTVGSSVRNASTSRSAFSSSVSSAARSGWRTCSSNISTASSAIARVASWCRRASASRSGSGKPASSRRSPARSDVDVGGGVARRAAALLRDDQTLAGDGVEQRPRARPTRCGEVVEREQLRVAVACAAAATAAASGTSAASSSPSSEAADHREREALALEVTDAGEPLDVVGAVPGDAALAAGRRQQPALLVEADRVDRHLGPAGPAPRPGCRRAPRFP